jgi:hypothetical protein
MLLYNMSHPPGAAAGDLLDIIISLTVSGPLFSHCGDLLFLLSVTCSAVTAELAAAEADLSSQQRCVSSLDLTLPTCNPLFSHCVLLCSVC